MPLVPTPWTRPSLRLNTERAKIATQWTARPRQWVHRPLLSKRLHESTSSLRSIVAGVSSMGRKEQPSVSAFIQAPSAVEWPSSESAERAVSLRSRQDNRGFGLPRNTRTNEVRPLVLSLHLPHFAKT